MVARARLSVGLDRHRVPRHSRVDVGQCAVHAGRGGRPRPRHRGRARLIGDRSTIWRAPAAHRDDHAVLLVMQGAVLAFFAFIGFEDMFNVAEEMRDPERTLPLGLILAMAAAALLYIAVAVTAVSVVPWAELAEAPGPITEVVGRAAPLDPAGRVHRHHAVRRRQHRARQLRHGLAPDLRHGAPGPAAAAPRQRSRRAADAACRHCRAFSRARAARASRHDRRACRGDGAAPAARVHGGERRAVHPEGTQGRETGALRDTALRAGARRAGLSRSDRGAGHHGRLAAPRLPAFSCSARLRSIS